MEEVQKRVEIGRRPISIYRGAEAVIYLLDELDGERVIVKERVKKGYRIQELDEKIRKLRTQGEEKLLSTARRAGLNIPKVLDSDKFKLKMEFIEGNRLKEFLNKSLIEKDIEKVSKLIGQTVAKLHETSLIHGDLTTSNMILKNHKIFLIDFGLGKQSKSVEDQATDLFLLYEAIKSTHFESLEKIWTSFLEGYKNYSKSKDVLKRLEQIEKRRRYKSD